MPAARIGRVLAASVAALGMAWGGPSPAQEPAPAPASPTVRVEFSPSTATVGDHLPLGIEVVVPEGARFEPPEIGPALGGFAVVEGRWGGPETTAGGTRWSWRGSIVSYRTGPVELPAIRIRVEDRSGQRVEAASEARSIEIASVLDDKAEEGEEQEIADLKPPASLPPDYGALVVAAGILALLLVASGLLWWLHRRYAARLAAVPAPHDPFHRVPPHEWVYAELQKLLERRLPEHGQVPLFFAELAWIVKRYLGGRYRIDLMERTTAELPDGLAAAGAEAGAVDVVLDLLGRCDMVKFAQVVPDSETCRAAIEQAYHIVDMTKPRAAGEPAALQGVA